MGDFEFQAVLLLLMLYVVFPRISGFVATEEKNTQADPLPATASAVAS